MQDPEQDPTAPADRADRLLKSQTTPSAVLENGEIPRQALKRGEIIDWEALEALLYYTVYERLRWRPGEEGQLLYCEPLFTPR